jgi:hypothetical protein
MKKIAVLFCCLLSLFGIIISVSNKLLNVYSDENKFILKNAEVLTQENNQPGQVTGAEFSMDCNTPINNKGKKCKNTVITCQGSTGTCTQQFCPQHH